MPGERYRHIFLDGYANRHSYTSPVQGGGAPRIPSRDRSRHSSNLKAQLDQAWQDAIAAQQHAAVHVERHGTYLVFEGEPGFDLVVKSLESLQAGIRLLNVTTEGEGDRVRSIATVYIPYEKRSYFVNKIQAYATENYRDTANPKNAKLVNSISAIRHAVLESFWLPEERQGIPGDTPAWVEVWLRTDGDDVVSGFEALLSQLEIQSSEGLLRFPERAVKLILANRQQLQQLIGISDDIAEFRVAKEVATFYVEMSNQEQAQVLQAFARRVHHASDGTVAVCILDTGVNNGHALIQPVLANRDLHTFDSAWGKTDDPNNPHGTLMAGTAAYGDLLAALNGSGVVTVNHSLESVKILPPTPMANPKRLWGYVTIQGASRAEIQAPNRKRVICMAVTSPDSHERGKPSSWSAAIDEMTSGYSDDTQRLFIVSAGNVVGSSDWANYPTGNLTREVQDPGQAWNALTVGAFTEKTQLTDPGMSSFSALAPAGGLSPYSTTSVNWPARKRPIKPEIVLEGGNVALGPNSSTINHEDLQLLSTHHDPQEAQFAPFGMTSASSALASCMAAQIQVQYPTARPETIRALMVHTADWTDAMRRQFLPSHGRGDYARLLRICGYGVPNLERALYCASNSLTLVSEAELQPFNKRGSSYVTQDMHLYSLPWPIEILSRLGEADVRMRVTLSYFIEPGPGEVGWDNRYMYPSHGLRFDVNAPTESEREFIQRINNQARDEDYQRTDGLGERWTIGLARNVGSIHSDIWEGHAVELAASNRIAIYPTVGWWRERHHLNRWNRRTRYSLIVSIQTPETSQDIYVAVAQQIRVPVEIEVGRQSRRP